MFLSNGETQWGNLGVLKNFCGINLSIEVRRASLKTDAASLITNILLGIVLKRNVDILYVFSFWLTNKLLKFQFIIF